MNGRFFIVLLRVVLFKIFGVDFDWLDEFMVRGLPGLNEVCQHNMVRGSGSSGSNPRWNLDLNLHPLEDLEVPAEENPEVEIDVYREKDPDRIQSILHTQLLERISKKENEIRTVLENMVREEIGKRGFSYEHFDFRKLDQLVSQVIREHAQRFDPDNPKQKLKSYSCLVTQLGKDTHGIAYQVKTNIERNLLDFIIQE